jgi:hypothetical protein
MTQPLPSSPTHGVGRLTGIVLGLAAFICVTMIGMTGYIKYQLDRAESVLAAPEASTTLEQEGVDHLRRAVGYGGFVGFAQNFAASHDAVLLVDMKTELKEAEDAFAHLPEQTPTEARRDMRAILDTFGMVMTRAEKSTADPTTVFSMADLAPLYAALPVLDARVAAAWGVRRSAAEGQAKLWGMLLTLTSWCSLILAASMTAGIYLVLRDRNSAPLRALSQSVKNMAQGDMRTPIWGIERRDSIGELARAVDMARYHFSQLPDMTLLSDDGPVRLRFEGHSRSVFESMLGVITRDSEQVSEKTSQLNESIARQQDTLSILTERVEAVLQKVESRAINGDQQVRQALHNMLGSAEGLKHAQEHAADQLNRILPYLQERARGMAEITQLTGKQVAHVLQSLILTERGLRKNGIESEQAIQKLSSTADSLGERLFGAVNLLQASGRVLAETTEKTQSRLDEVIDNLKTPTRPETEDVTPRISEIVDALEQAQSKMENLFAEQSEATRVRIDLLTTQSTGLLTQTTTAAQTISFAADKLRDQQAALDDAIGRFATHLHDVGTETQPIEMVERQHPDLIAMMQAQLSGLAAQIGLVSEQISSLESTRQTSSDQSTAAAQPDFIGTLLHEMKSGFEHIGIGLEQTREQIATSRKNSTPDSGTLGDAVQGQWYQMAAQIEATRGDLARIISEEVSRLEVKLAGLGNGAVSPAETSLLQDAQVHIEKQTLILSDLVAMLSDLDTHLKDIRNEVADKKRAG